MSKVADVRLGWVKSPSTDVKKVTVIVTKDGTETTTEVGPEVQEIQIVVEALKSVQFKVVVENTDGLTATSDVYSFTLDSLESPQPVTGLFHEVIGIRDIPDVPPAPPTP